MELKDINVATDLVGDEEWRSKLSLKNADLGELMRLLGDTKQLAKQLEKIEGFLKEAVKARWPEDTHEFTGGGYYATLTSGAQERLDSDKVKAYFGDDWRNYAKVIETTTLRVTKADKPPTEE